MTDAPEREWMDTEKIYLIGRCSDPRIGHVMFREPAVPSAVEHTPYIRADLVPSWQPIETAPRDGTRILVFGRGRRKHGYGSDVAVDWYSSKYDYNDDGHGFGEFNRSAYPATHWMPLPEPPDA